MNDTAETTARPNILLIHADQHRFDCLGAYGNPDIQTPNIDALAQDGVLYEASFCPFPVCTPSRYSLLSSQYVHQHLGWTNHSTLPNGIPTFPKVLRANGYSTKAVGKMHFTPTYLDVGFDEMILSRMGRDASTTTTIAGCARKDSLMPSTLWTSVRSSAAWHPSFTGRPSGRSALTWMKPIIPPPG